MNAAVVKSGQSKVVTGCPSLERQTCTRFGCLVTVTKYFPSGLNLPMYGDADSGTVASFRPVDTSQSDAGGGATSA